MTPTKFSRRSVLTGAGAVFAATLTGAPSAHATKRSIAALERRYDRRIGLYAKNLRTGQELSHRADERFALCSTFKPFAVAAVLTERLITPDPDVMERRVHYPPSLVAGDVWAPYTRQWFADGYVPTMAEVCEVAVRDSDNGAANLVLQHIGGPATVTRLVRDLGDEVTRLDRWDPDMSEFEPGQTLDTSTPRALGSSYRSLILGSCLPPDAKNQITEWLLGNRANPPFRAALPTGWQLADKTGSGGYATRNDVGIAWTDDGTPILVSCMTRADQPDAERIDAPLTEAFKISAEQLT